MAKTEIRAEFKLDDMASASLSKIQGGFGKLTGTINNATSSLGDFLKQTAAVAIGVNLGNIMGSMKDVATSAFRSAVDADMQMRALTRTMEGLSSTRGRSLSSFQNEAKGVYSALSDIARVSGVARGEIVKAFQDAGANTVLTGAKLTEFVGKAALISRGMGIPVQEITAGFESLRKNMVDASNPLVALVKQANLMRGHSERIAMKMQMMGRGGMIRLAEKAMGIMAERAKSIPLTFDEMGAQLGDMKDDMLKLIGGPMVNTLRPLFERFTGYVTTNRGAIAAYAETMGKQAGVWIERATKAAQEGFGYLRSHAQEIGQAVERAFDYAKSIFQWMLDHKLAIGGAMVASKVAPMAGSAIGGAMALGKALQGLSSVGLPGLGVAAGGAATGLLGMTVALGAFALMVGGLGLAFDQARKLVSEWKPAGSEDQKAREGALTGVAADFTVWDDKQQKAFTVLRQKIVDGALAMGQNSRVAGEAADAAYKQHVALANATRGMQEASKIAQGIPADIGSMAEGAALDAAIQAQVGASRAFTESFNAIGLSGNKAAQMAAVEILRGNKSLQESLLKTGTEMGLSLDKLAEIVGDKLGDFGDKLKKQAGLDEQAKATEGKGAVPTQVFNGGQTFQIKQDFRDQDPDRIAVIFQRDIARAAENRLQGGTGGAFGA